MKFSRNMCLMIILKVTINQGFALCLEDTFFEKPHVYVDPNNTSVAFPTMVHSVIENVYKRSNFNYPNQIYLFPNLLTDPNQNQHPLCQNQTLASVAWKVSGNSILQKAYLIKQLTCLKVVKDRAH